MNPDFKQIEEGFQVTADKKCTESAGGMVSTASPQASEAGAEMLKAGGNAMDAAVAAAFTLGVTEPQASGLGGQTMLLLNYRQKVVALDGSSRAPSLAHVNAIYKPDRSLSYRATTVPSTPATLGYAHQKYGKLPWEKILEPAIHFARQGYPIGHLQNWLQGRELEKFQQVESRSGLEYFYKNENPYTVGDIFKQPDLADLLERLSRKGVEEFYHGTTARQIDADMRENGGLLRYDDLSWIPYPYERKPLRKRIQGMDVYTMPPPGSGRTLLSTLMMLELFSKIPNIKEENHRYLIFLKIIRRALLERRDRPYEPNFYPQVAEEAAMLNQRYIRKYLKKIISEVDKSMLPFIPTEDEASGETTHLSVMDQNGMAVSLTQSIERVYGSKAAAAGLGFLYNNYLFDFEYELPEHPFYLRPNSVPWATVTPTLIMNRDKVWMALGSPGSERIISTLALFLYNVLEKNMPIDQAMKEPRLHCSLGGRVSLEADRFDGKMVDYFKEKGFRIDKRSAYSFYLGCLQAVLRKNDLSGFQGVADIRREGTAVGA